MGKISMAPTAEVAVDMTFNFHDELVAQLPRLRIHALSLTKNRAAADDLLQTAVASALAHQGSFTPGTNLSAWMYRILRNRFLSDCRAARDEVEIDTAPAVALSRAADQEQTLVVKELAKHMERLPADQRSALIMVAVQGMSYIEVAEIAGACEGTVKCRVFRARKQLETWLLGDGQGRRATIRRPGRRAGSAPAMRGLPFVNPR
jgi:RNA polymerase sigma-70 factor (ECF subfamily)